MLHVSSNPTYMSKTVFCPLSLFSGGKNKPVLSHQARESGQWANRGPGAARCLCFVRAVTNDGKIHRETQVRGIFRCIHPLVNIFLLKKNSILFAFYFNAKYVLCVCATLLRSFTHFLTGVCAIIGGVFTGQPLSLTVFCGVGENLRRHFSLLILLIFSVLLHSCSGWSDRLAHLPLGSGHPEEDRAGQGVLTVPLSPLPRPHLAASGATQTRTRTRRLTRRTDGEREVCCGIEREAERFQIVNRVFNSSVSLSVVDKP